jgi:hypothetical protein
MMEARKNEKQYVLHVYFFRSGQVSGRLFCGAVEVFFVACCASVDQLRQAFSVAGHRVDFVVDAATGEGL